MNVTIICDVLGKENNGTTIAAVNLINSLKSKGHRVNVVCPDEGRKNQDGFYVVKPINFGPFNNYVAKNGVSISYPDKEILSRAIEGADVVHLTIPFFLAAAALKIAREKNIPVTASFHCQAENITNHIFLMNSDFANNFTYRFLYKHVYKYCDAIHYPTQFIRDVFENACGEKTNGYVISNGVCKLFTVKEAEKPEKLKGKFVIVFTGRYSKEKSHRVLLDAVELSSHRDEIQLIFAGAGPCEKKLKEYAEKKNINFPIFKFFDRAELVDVLNYADLYVHPAEIEIEAVSCLEAICCGLVPVISDSKRSATNHFALDEKSLFECNNPRSLADKIDYWIEHPKEKAEYRQRYLDTTKKFDVDDCMAQMENMLIKVARSQ